MILNETPIRTSKNFNINNIKLEVEIPKNVQKFNNVEVINNDSKILINDDASEINLTYGIGKEFEEQVNKNANSTLKIVVDSDANNVVNVKYKFDANNINLINKIEIDAKENSKAHVVLEYQSNANVDCFHNEILKLNAEKNSNINITIANLLNEKTNHFVSIQNSIESNAKVKYTIVDFGGKNSITNYYSNLTGEEAENIVNTIYLGKENQLFDLNYIGELRGKKSNIDINVKGALKDEAKKHFKGTIDFKTGCKKAKGSEDEFCMLLSDKAKSLGLPMLLCSEEDVEGSHASAAGKIGEKELFYIMSRGFSFKEAMKLMVRAKFNKVLEEIESMELKEKILNEIDKRLD